MKVTFGVETFPFWDVHLSPLPGEGRVSVRFATRPLGDAAQERITYRWWGAFRNGGAPADPRREIQIYIIGAQTSTGPAMEGSFDELGGVLTDYGRSNLWKRLQPIVVDDVSPHAIYRGSGYFETDDPFIQVASFNDIGAPLSREPGAHWLCIERVAALGGP